MFHNNRTVICLMIATVGEALPLAVGSVSSGERGAAASIHQATRT